MAEQHQVSAEFETAVDDQGGVRIPTVVRDVLGIKPGERLRFRVATHGITAVMRKNGVTFEEIEAIAALQMEPAEQVVTFLLSEGKLARRRKHKRAR